MQFRIITSVGDVALLSVGLSKHKGGHLLKQKGAKPDAGLHRNQSTSMFQSLKE